MINGDKNQISKSYDYIEFKDASIKPQWFNAEQNYTVSMQVGVFMGTEGAGDYALLFPYRTYELTMTSTS